MKAKRNFVIASTVFVGINIAIFVALWLFIIIKNSFVSKSILNYIHSISTVSDIGYWLNTTFASNISVIIFLIILLMFLMIVGKVTFLYHFIKYCRYGIKDFYTRRGKYLALSILQVFLIGTIFGMLCGITAIVIQKALVTPETLPQVLADTWGQDTGPVGQAQANDNKPVVRVGPNAKFVENIAQLRDGVRYLAEAGLISKAQRNSLNKKIDKLSKDRAKKQEMRGQ